MGKAVKAVKRVRATRKKSPFPIGPDVRWFLAKIKEAEEARLMACSFGSPDARRSPAQEKQRNAHREKWESIGRELRDLGDAVAERFRIDPRAVTMEDVLTLSLAAYNSKEAQNEVCRAVVQIADLKWPMSRR